MPSIALAILTAAGLRVGDPASLPESLPTDRDFARMVGGKHMLMGGITSRLGKAQISVLDWADMMDAILLDGHTEAAWMGRELGIQEVSARDLVDLVRGRAAADGEQFYLRGFVQALIDKDPRYWDAELEAWREDQIMARQASYLGKMRGTANGAMIEESPKDKDIWWRLGGTEDHCEECPEWAAMSPFKKGEMPTHPGDNDTPCRFNCLCYIEIDDFAGFRPVRL